MARKTLDYTVASEGRDKGKLFRITEMSAGESEEWAMRALLALSNSGAPVPEDFLDMGMPGIAIVGMRALTTLKWAEAKPLLDKMLECVRIIPDPKRPQVIRAIIEEDIEEVETRLKLREEVFRLHTDFLDAAVSSLKEMWGQAKGGSSSDAPTSQEPLQP